MKATMQSLIEKIESHPDFNVPQGAWVSVYRRSQNYGGPEEGGWWYNRSTLEGSVFFPAMETAEAWLEKAKAEARKIVVEARKQAEGALASEGKILANAEAQAQRILADAQKKADTLMSKAASAAPAAVAASAPGPSPRPDVGPSSE